MRALSSHCGVLVQLLAVLFLLAPIAQCQIETSSSPIAETRFCFEGDSYVYFVTRLAVPATSAPTPSPTVALTSAPTVRPTRAIVQRTSSPTTMGGGKWSRKTSASPFETTFSIEGDPYVYHVRRFRRNISNKRARPPPVAAANGAVRRPPWNPTRWRQPFLSKATHIRTT